MKIIQERKKCIGCGSCAAICSQYFEMADDGLAALKGGQIVGDNMELGISETACAKDAANVCPVQIIRVEE